MDVLEILRARADALPDGDQSVGIRAVLSHISTAEKYFVKAIDEKEDDFFTDVIYRCNQAFEGSLKEAFRTLAKQDPNRVRPYDIEKYLDENSVFNKRVLDLLNNYRVNWRNPSTHDYSLFFGKQEAFLALSSVSAFMYLLIEQISEQISHDIESKKLEAAKAETEKARAQYSALPLKEKIRSILLDFSRDQGGYSTEVETLGSLAAYLDKVAPDIKVLRDTPVGNNSLARPDFVLRSGDEIAIIEVKNAARRPARALSSNAVSQMLSYLQAAEANLGFILYSTDDSSRPVEALESPIEMGNTPYTVVQIVPGDAPQGTH